MNCPVCNEKMKEIERSGVMIDLCPGCKGIWLDRGELEKLLAMDAGEEAKQDAEPATELAKAPPQTGVYAPIPDEMPAEFKHQDRGRFREMARHAGSGGHGGTYKPAGGKIPGQRGGGGRSSAIGLILKSIDTGG
jgi:Zn-finger nucleic acid-binding protein